MKGDDLPSWEREHYSPGGGDPFLYYVAFGDMTTEAENQISAARYRCAGVPEGIEITSYDKDAHLAVFDMFMQGYLWENLQAENPALAADVRAAPCCIVLQGEVHDPRTLNYLRDIVGIVTFLFDNGGAVVYDPLMFQWWSATLWKERIFEPGAPVPRHHTLILVSKEEDDETTAWVHTRGMRKFGRPDISLRHVENGNLDGAIDLCNRFVEHQAFGGIIPEGREIHMASLPPGGITRHGGYLDDPDFNNVHVEIDWGR